MEGLVYLTILATGVWSTIVAVVAPRILGFTSDPTRRRAVMVGANPLTGIIGELLTASGKKTLAIDGASWRLDRFRSAGLNTVCGDARDAVTHEEAGVERDSTVVVATTNDELNLLVAELVHTEFGVEHPVVAIARPPDDLGRRSRGWLDLLGGRDVDVPRWNRRIDNHKTYRLRIDVQDADKMALLRQAEREHPDEVLRLAGKINQEITLAVKDQALTQLEYLEVLVVADSRAREILEAAVIETEDQPSIEEESTEDEISSNDSQKGGDKT
jgi:hypothetical protein